MNQEKLSVYTAYEIVKKIKDVANNIEAGDKKIVEKFISQPPKDIIYTSFNGDYINYIYNICSYEIQRGNIPLNPELGLGYYVSTMTLGGIKQRVMEDCLTLEMLSNKMSVYRDKTYDFAEGIVAEMILWNSIKKSGVDVISDIENPMRPFKDEKWDTNKLNDFVSNLAFQEKSELYNNLLLKYNNDCHYTVYIIANFKNFKHIDWARCYCYKNNVCPISPQNILPYFLYFDKIDEYKKSRLELLKRSDEIYLFIDKRNIYREIEMLDQFSLIELYYLLKYEKHKKITIVGWDEAGVPKYVMPKKWALTEKERL